MQKKCHITSNLVIIVNKTDKNCSVVHNNKKMKQSFIEN